MRSGAGKSEGAPGAGQRGRTGDVAEESAPFWRTKSLLAVWREPVAVFLIERIVLLTDRPEQFGKRVAEERTDDG